MEGNRSRYKAIQRIVTERSEDGRRVEKTELYLCVYELSITGNLTLINRTFVDSMEDSM